MALDMWTSEDLYALRQDERMNPLPSFILDTFFNLDYYSEDGTIRFADLPEADRFLAPFVLPYDQGKPLDYRKGYSVSDFTPAYIKLKNGVRPEDARIPSPRFLLNRTKPSLAERFDMRVAELMEMHLRAIQVRKIWMAARAFIDGKVQIDYDRDQGAANPSVLLDFGRAAGHTITLADEFWSDPDAPILDHIEEWMSTMYLANGGGTAAQLIVGAQVAPVFRKNKQIISMLDKNVRSNTDDVQISLGIMRTERPLTRIGQLTTGLEILTYKDTVDIPNGSGGKTKIDLFHEKDVLLVAPGATGVQAHGAIYDVDAIEQGAVATDVYSKMFKTDDPGELFLMNQSSPLMIPLYPNRTLKARVLA